MRFVKLGLISFVMLFLLFTGISLFIPSQINISRAINLSSSQRDVLQQIEDTSKWARWYPGYDTVRLKGTLINITDTEKDKVSAEFSRTGATRKIKSDWRIIPYSHTDSFTLHWSMQFNLRWYPWEKFGSLLYEKSYGQQMEQGLSNLKENGQ